MTQLHAGYDRQAVRELIERAVAERRSALTAPQGKKVPDACGRSSASGRAPPPEVFVGAAGDWPGRRRPGRRAWPARSASRQASPGPVRRNCRTPDLDAAFRAHIPSFGPAGNPIGITGGEPP